MSFMKAWFQCLEIMTTCFSIIVFKKEHIIYIFNIADYVLNIVFMYHLKKVNHAYIVHCNVNIIIVLMYLKFISYKIVKVRIFAG